MENRLKGDTYVSVQLFSTLEHRGSEEQRRLGPPQFTNITEPDCYTFVEHRSKNRIVAAVPEDIRKC